MKESAGIIRKYIPVWILVLVMVLLFFTSTLPAIHANREMARKKAGKSDEIRAMKEKIRRVQNELKALDSDPVTIENELRKHIGGAKRKGEVQVDYEP